jgi:hypothetical protein
MLLYFAYNLHLVGDIVVELVNRDMKLVVQVVLPIN